MTEFFIPLWAMAALFGLVALTYATVGLGGGSSYVALMVIFGFTSVAIPNLSLLFNLIVTSVGCFNFIRRGHLRWELLLPFIVLSIPMAWVGGALQISEFWFRLLLLLSLLVVLARIFFWREASFRLDLTRIQTILLSLVVGAALGLLAGIVGNGGGIFLVPVILILGLGTIQQAAACGLVFIWLNSLAGLISRSQYNFVDFTDFLPLIVAVAIGGLIGSLIGSSRINPRILEKILGIVIGVAILILGHSLIPG